MRSAQTDVTLDVEDLGNFVLPSSKTLPCRISSIDRLASDGRSLKMVREDLKSAERNELVKQYGYKAMDFHE